MDYKGLFDRAAISFRQIPAEIKTREFVLSIAGSFNFSLAEVPEYQDDDEIALKSVLYDGRQFHDVSERLKHDERIALATITKNRGLIKLLPLSFLRNKSFAIKAVTMHPSLVHYFSYDIKLDPEFIKVAKITCIPPKSDFVNPKKTVTIKITTHGTDLESLLSPDLPTNSVIGGSVGICKINDKSSCAMLVEKIDHLKELYATHNIKDANAIYECTSFHDPIAYRDLYSTLQKIHPNENIDELYSRETSYKRQYYKDHKYENNFDMPNFPRGIFIIHSDIELPTFTGDIPVIGYQNSKESQESLQRLNLMNGIVSRHFGNGGFEAFGAVVKEFEFMGKVDQYEFLTLTHILLFFQSLGFEHVNILDESCRVHESVDQPHNSDAPTELPTPPELPRERSDKEKERYPFKGGKTKRKRKTNKTKTNKTKTKNLKRQ
jgi:hypothetical protein